MQRLAKSFSPSFVLPARLALPADNPFMQRLQAFRFGAPAGSSATCATSTEPADLSTTARHVRTALMSAKTTAARKRPLSGLRPWRPCRCGRRHQRSGARTALVSLCRGRLWPKSKDIGAISLGEAGTHRSDRAGACLLHSAVGIPCLEAGEEVKAVGSVWTRPIRQRGQSNSLYRKIESRPALARCGRCCMQSSHHTCATRLQP